VSATNTNQRSLFGNSNEDRKKREGATILKMEEVTSTYLEGMEVDSAFFGGASTNCGSGTNNDDGGEKRMTGTDNGVLGVIVPRFAPNEIELETTIAMGEFGVVLKIGTISLNPENKNNKVNASNGETVATHPATGIKKRSGQQQYPHQMRSYFVAVPTNVVGVLSTTGSDLVAPSPTIIPRRSRSINNADLVLHGNVDGTTVSGSSSSSSGGSNRTSNHRNHSSNDKLVLQLPPASPFLWLPPVSHSLPLPSSGTNSDAEYNNDEDNLIVIAETTDRVLRERLAKTCLRKRRSSNHETSTAVSSAPRATTATATTTPSDSSGSRLVIKQIRKDLYPRKRIEAAKDLAKEAKILARFQQLYFSETVTTSPGSSSQESSSQQQQQYSQRPTYGDNHPNIISLRGIVSDPGSPDFGIILDRLDLTLTECAASWGNQQEEILERFATITDARNIKAPSSFSSLLLLPAQFPLRAVVGATQKLGGWFAGEGGKKGHEGSGTIHSPGSTSSNSPAATLHQRDAEEVSDSGEGTSTISSSPPENLLLLGERILALWDVAEGMRHLHKHNIMFRDLKTENVGRTIGFRPSGNNVDGKSSSNDSSRVDKVIPNSLSSLLQNCANREYKRMQIFDFGLAKECKTSKITSRFSSTNAITNSNTTSVARRNSLATDLELDDSFYDTYKLTGLTGTMRIMAPEVIQCLPYGLPADVYSFGICMWEVFKGTKCNFLSAAEICDTETMIRPELPVVFDPRTGSVGMPKKIQKLMQKCWHEDSKKRPDFGKISKSLRDILTELYRQLPCPPEELQQRQPYEHSNSVASFLSKRTDRRRHLLTPWRSCGNNGSGGFWNTDNKNAERRRQPQQGSQRSSITTGSLDHIGAAHVSSDIAAFWSRLEEILASEDLEVND